jgi:CheY-like chemotaxis protein
MGIPGQPPAVLVVDDEPLIRMHVAATIEEARFKVYEAANADQAVEILEKVEDITVLLTDVNMPGSMNGVELAHYARSYWPVKVIVTTGYRDIENKAASAGRRFSKKTTTARKRRRKLEEYDRLTVRPEAAPHAPQSFVFKTIPVAGEH